MKFAGEGIKLSPKSPFPSKRSPWQRKQFLIYIVPPSLIELALGEIGLLIFFREIFFPWTVTCSGVSLDVGAVKPQDEEGRARKNKTIRNGL